MAKQRLKTDFDDQGDEREAGASASVAVVGTAEAERAALEARVRELEAALRERPIAPRVEAGPNTGFWRVELEGAPTHVVQAVDAANAWEMYRAEMGVISSINTPKLSSSDKRAWHEAQARRRGLKPDEWRGE